MYSLSEMMQVRACVRKLYDLGTFQPFVCARPVRLTVGCCCSTCVT